MGTQSRWTGDGESRGSREANAPVAKGSEMHESWIQQYGLWTLGGIGGEQVQLQGPPAEVGEQDTG